MSDISSWSMLSVKQTVLRANLEQFVQNNFLCHSCPHALVWFQRALDGLWPIWCHEKFCLIFANVRCPLQMVLAIPPDPKVYVPRPAYPAVTQGTWLNSPVWANTEEQWHLTVRCYVYVPAEKTLLQWFLWEGNKTKFVVHSPLCWWPEQLFGNAYSRHYCQTAQSIKAISTT